MALRIGDPASSVRAMARAGLRVVVREHGVRLRASQALALMRLGLPPSSPPICQTRPPSGWSTHCMERVSPGPVVERLLAAADDFDIESCLVRLEFSGADPAGVVKIAWRLGRDLVAFAQGNVAWLFVFGCPHTMAPAMLQRLFMSPGTGSWPI